MADEDHSARPRGRPRSDSVDRALTEATLEEFLERGYHAMSMESIAARAGVSKVSLYRRWNSKLAAVTGVLQLLRKTTPIGDHGSLAADVRALVEQSAGSSEARAAAKVVMRMIGEISGDEELRAAYRTHLFAPRLDQLRVLVERARARGELRADLPADIACAMIGGPLFLYHFTLVVEAEVDVSLDLVEEMTRAILNGIADGLGGRGKGPVGASFAG